MLKCNVAGCSQQATFTCVVGTCAPIKRWCSEHYIEAHLGKEPVAASPPNPSTILYYTAMKLDNFEKQIAELREDLHAMEQKILRKIEEK